ncbi:hypothetical protein [Catenuloplanes atrovinosus]|uniref:Uncharacterized protein n=1 Tax=Catenuloplanes atrovinosus TaxID=137266 RepID=A0AAE4CDS6_9ACTN|nr:hypothetical protein [Catenuloplanes atrovinosus]MDR7277845.1 hypothetical protein [Catenuloplanes atrovinosus]
MVTGSHRATGGLRRYLRDYAWIIVAIVLAVAVALCSLPFTSRLAPSWKAGAPASSASVLAGLAAATAAAAGPDATPTAAPTPSAEPGSPTPVPSPTRSRTSAGTPRPASPAPGRATNTAPGPRTTTALLGPVSGGELQATIRLYCWQEFGASEARLRSGTDPATDNWECRGHGFHDLVDMHALCSWRHGTGAYAAFTDRHDAYSWRCYRTRSA